jgi:hypothetical protein
MATPSLKSLSGSNGSDSLLTAAKGTFIVNNTSEKVLKCRAIVVLEDTVFAHIKEFGINTDVKANYIASTATALKAGCIITPNDGKFFEKIALLSGSVILIK